MNAPDSLGACVCVCSIAVALEPLVAHYWTLRAKCHRLLAQFEDAEKDMMASLSLRPPSEIDERK